MSQQLYAVNFFESTQLLEICRIMDLAWELNQELKKYKLSMNHIPYRIILENIVMVDMDQRAIAKIDVDKLLEDNGMYEHCLKELSIEKVLK